MQTLITQDKLLKLGLPVILGFLAILSVSYFNQVSGEELDKLNAAGTVAGTQDKKEILDLSKEMPIFPDSDILSIDRRNNEIYVVMQSTLSDAEIESYYKEYLFQNEWKPDVSGAHTKNGKLLSYTLNNGVIQVKLVNP